MIIHKFSYFKRFVQFILVVALLISNLPMAAGGTDWDSALNDINGLHGNYTSLQAALKSDSSKIQILRKQNNETLKSIHTVIESTDKALLSRLSSEATTVQRSTLPSWNNTVHSVSSLLQRRKLKTLRPPLSLT